MEMVKKCVEEGLLSPTKVAPLRDWLKMRKKKKGGVGRRVGAEEEEEEEDELLSAILSRSHDHPKFRHFPPNFSLLRQNLYEDEASRDVFLLFEESSDAQTPRQQHHPRRRDSSTFSCNGSSPPPHHRQTSILKTHSTLLTHSGSPLLTQLLSSGRQSSVDPRMRQIAFPPEFEPTSAGLKAVLESLYFGNFASATTGSDQRWRTKEDNLVVVDSITRDSVEHILPLASRLGLRALTMRCEKILIRIISATEDDDAADDDDIDVVEIEEGCPGRILKAIHVGLKQGVGIGESAVETLERKSLPKYAEGVKCVSLQVLWFILKKTTLLR